MKYKKHCYTYRSTKAPLRKGGWGDFKTSSFVANINVFHIRSRFFNRFLIADLILGVFLIVAGILPNRFQSVIMILAAYAYSAGVFMVATSGGLLLSEYNFGAFFTTTIGLIPCSIFVVLLSRWLLQRAFKSVSS